MKQISENALLYALWELSRRAGVTFDFFSRWDVHLRDRCLIVRPISDVPGEIHFPIFSDSEKRTDGIAHKVWGREVPTEFREHIPDFIVPFCRHDSMDGDILFAQKGARIFQCTEDLLSSLLFTLSRREESASRSRDLHDRFPSSLSLASRHGYLMRPIVDEYGLAFQRILRILVPAWKPTARKVTMKLSHDLDELGIPFRIQCAVGHTLLRGAPFSMARDLVSSFTAIEPAYLRAARTICEISLQRGMRSALYLESAAITRFDTGYGLTHPKIARLLDWAKGQGIELGVHPSYETFRSRAALQEEVQRIRAAIGKDNVGGRQHFLRWCPETWTDWESCGLAYDSSVGFVDQVGFRCGTCFPFLPWLWEQDRPADLLEIPPIVMDGALVWYTKRNPQQSLKTVRKLFNICSLAGGVLTLLWHNTSLFRPYARHYPPILDLLSGTNDYDWESDLKKLRREYRELSQKAVNSGDYALRTAALPLAPPS